MREQLAERRGKMLADRACVQQLIEIALIYSGDEPIGLMVGQKIKEGLRRAVHRSIALAA